MSNRGLMGFVSMMSHLGHLGFNEFFTCWFTHKRELFELGLSGTVARLFCFR